jgi:hypothetical protein
MPLRWRENPTRGNEVSKQDEYRKLAALTFDVAGTAGSSGDKTQLLVMADGWRHLAERARKLPGAYPAGDTAEGVYSRSVKAGRAGQ